MENKLDLILQKLDVLEAGQKKLDAGLKALETGQTTLDAGLKEIYQIVRALWDRQEETDAKLDSISMDVHKLHGEVTSLKEGQDRQDKILQSLAMRSLEQETELRELKRVK